MVTPHQLALVRHGRSTYNVEHRLNGDPSVPVGLDATGTAQVRELRRRIDPLPVDLAVHTRFPRTRQTLDILLDGREVPRRECPGLDDVLLGEFEGAHVDAYREWRDGRDQAARPEGGESRLDALSRYTDAFERLAAIPARLPLVVTHDIPIRFLANAIRGEDPLDGPVTAVANASLLLVPADDLRRAIIVMRATLTAGAG